MHATGLRSYNPRLGRWINRDPIGEDGGENLYGMIDNSPLVDIDLIGLSSSRKVSVAPVLNALKRKLTTITCSGKLDISSEVTSRSPTAVPYFSVHQAKYKGELHIFWGDEKESDCKTPSGDWSYQTNPSDAKTMYEGDYGTEIKAIHPAASVSTWLYFQAKTVSFWKSSLKARMGMHGEAEALYWEPKICCKCLHIKVSVSTEAQVVERSIKPRMLAAEVVLAYVGVPAIKKAGTTVGKEILETFGKELLNGAGKLRPLIIP